MGGDPNWDKVQEDRSRAWVAEKIKLIANETSKRARRVGKEEKERKKEIDSKEVEINWKESIEERLNYEVCRDRA